MIDKLKTELLLLKPNCLHNCKDIVKKKQLLTAPGSGCHYTSEMCPGSLYSNISGKTSLPLCFRSGVPLCAGDVPEGARVRGAVRDQHHSPGPVLDLPATPDQGSRPRESHGQD